MTLAQRFARAAVIAPAAIGLAVLTVLALQAGTPTAPTSPAPGLLVALVACAVVVCARLRVWRP